MNIIDWDKIYELAKNSSKEVFIASAERMLTKVNEQPHVERFMSHMEKYEKKILPSLLQNNTNLTPQKFAQIVINAVKKDTRLMNAFIQNPASMFASILFGAEIGLVPSDEIGELFLIPRNLKQDDLTYKLTVTPLIGYKGLAKIIMRTGNIEKIDAHVVYEGEKFKVSLGTNPKLEHTPKYEILRTAEKITHAYCVAHFKSGEKQFAVITRAEILATRDKAKSPNELYFNDAKNPNRWMEKKCALIQLSKLIDKDYYGSKAIEYDGIIEGGAMLTLDQNDQIKLIDGAPVKPARFRNIYGTLNQLPNS